MTDSQLKECLYRIAVENDQRAFSMFFDQYHTRLLRYANLHMKNMQEAEDIVSDVLIRLLKHREETFLKENFLGFLFKCIKNQCLDAIRKEKRRASTFESTYHEGDYFAFDNQTPFSRLVHSELDVLIKKRIENLPPKRRLVFTLVKDDHMPQKEVADLLGISVRTVETHLKLAVQDIKEAVEEYLGKSDLDLGDRLHIAKAISLVLVSALS